MLPKSSLGRSVRQLRVSRTSGRPHASGQWQHSRRGYASASETAQKAKEKAQHGAKVAKSSDLPWAIPAVAVTIGGTYAILANGSSGAEKGYPGEHYHGEHGEEHEEGEEGGEEGGEESGEGGGEEAEDKQEAGEEKQETEQQEAGEEGSKEESKDEAQEQADAQSEQKDEGAQEGDEGSQDSSGGSSKLQRSENKNVPGQPEEDKISKKTKDGQDAKFTDTVELDNGDSPSRTIHKPDAKGGAKRRIESSYGNKLGHNDDAEGGRDHATSGLEPKEGGVLKKQAGLSNTETKHSIDIASSPEKSKKADGTPETAKAMGTVDSRNTGIR